MQKHTLTREEQMELLDNLPQWRRALVYEYGLGPVLAAPSADVEEAIAYLDRHRAERQRTFGKDKREWVV